MKARHGMAVLMTILLTAVSAQQFTNNKGEVCHPKMTGFHWSGFNGEWEPVDGVTVGGKPVFKRRYNGNGITLYLWHETDYPYWHGKYDSAWVIGEHYNLNWSNWGWKWGDDLFDYNPAGWHGWQYWNGLSWKQHPTEPVVSCSWGTNAASITFSGDGMVGPGIDGTDTVPNMPNDAAKVSANYFSVIVGAAFGAVVVVAAAIAVLVMRRKQTTKPAASTKFGAHHVAELSPTDIAMAVADVIPAETQSPEAVVVEEEAVPKKSEAVSAEK